MLLFAHLGLAVLIGKPAKWIAPRIAGPTRYWVLGAILPDVIDKGLNIWGHGWEHHTRSIAHSLTFALLLLIVGLRWIQWRATGFGVLTHLAADVPWTFRQTFLWPASGPEFTPGSPVSLDQYLARLRDPTIATSEMLGALVFAFFLLSLVLRRLAHDRSEAPAEASSDADDAA